MIIQWLKYLFLKCCAVAFWLTLLGSMVYALNEWSWVRWAFATLAVGLALFIWGTASYEVFVEQNENEVGKATRQGRKAYWAGVPFTDNPYLYSSPAEHAAWAKGWFSAERENS